MLVPIDGPRLGPSGRRASETKSLTHPHWNSGYPTRHPAINHKIMDNRCPAVFRELRSAVSVERGEKWKQRFCPVGTRGCFLHFDGIKEFERATMTRIGRCQIKTHNLLAMLPPGETISPRSKFLDQTASIKTSVPTSLGCLVLPYLNDA